MAPEDMEPSSERNPEEIRRGVRMGGEDGKSREQVSYERIIARVEPTLKGSTDRLSVYTNLFESEMIHDTRLFAASVTATADEESGAVRLAGYVPFEENKIALGKLFQYLGFENVINEAEVLPSADLGENRFAIVTATRTRTYDKPTEPRETMNEALMGDTVFLLKESENGFFLCATSEGYISQIDGTDLVRVNAARLTAYNEGPRAVPLRNARVDGSDRVLPVGARLKLIAGEEGGPLRVLLPDGVEVDLAAGAARVYSDDTDARAEAAIAVAEDLYATDYVWGGNSSDGIDCSGLVQTSYRTQGVSLARDAYQQAVSGRLVATRWYREGLRRGDLLYFIGANGRISHTAIYIGDDMMIEASGTVKYTSMNPLDANYDARRYYGFAFAKRLFQ